MNTFFVNVTGYWLWLQSEIAGFGFRFGKRYGYGYGWIQIWQQIFDLEMDMDMDMGAEAVVGVSDALSVLHVPR